MLSARTREWIELSCGAAISSATRLHGGLSSSIHRVQLHDGSTVVVRQITDLEGDFDVRLQEAIDEIINEARVLRIMQGQANAPRLIGSDPHGEHCGYATSIQTMVPGSLHVNPTNPTAWAEQLADLTAAIANFVIEPDQLESLPAFVPWWPESAVTPTWSTDPAQWERIAVGLRNDLPLHGPPQLVHRDLHPANVLFDRDGQWSGTVDWVHGCRGPVQVDVARCRVQIAFLTDLATADHYLATCQAKGVLHEYDQRWDALVAIELSPWIREIAKTYRGVGSTVTKARIAEVLNAFVA